MSTLDRPNANSLAADRVGVSGAITPALRFHFAGIAQEPLPEHLAVQLRKLEAEPDERSREGRNSWDQQNRHAGKH
jgi:hypothetical protein